MSFKSINILINQLLLHHTVQTAAGRPLDPYYKQVTNENKTSVFKEGTFKNKIRMAPWREEYNNETLKYLYCY